MSPILVRPVREQLEHDRVIRQLQKNLTRRKIEVAINPGSEQNVGLGSAVRKEFPDVVLFSTDKGRKVVGIVEVETGESVNYLEAMAQWAHYAKLKAPFHLYVPMGSVDVARRLASNHQIQVAEIHTYHQIGDLVRFASVYRSGHAPKLADEPQAEPITKAKPPAVPPAVVPTVKKAAASAKAGPERTAVVKAVPAKVALLKVSPLKATLVKAAPVKAGPAKLSAVKPARIRAKPVAKRVVAPPKPVVAKATRSGNAVVKKVAKPAPPSATARKVALKKPGSKRK